MNTHCTHCINAGGEYFVGVQLNKIHLVHTVFYLLSMRISWTDSVFLK
jgi:hypothetical protein